MLLTLGVVPGSRHFFFFGAMSQSKGEWNSPFLPLLSFELLLPGFG